MLNHNFFTDQLVAQSFHERVRWVVYAVLIFFGIVVLRSFYLQIYMEGEYRELSEQKYNRTTAVRSQRGTIYDSEGNILSVSLPLQSLYLVPREIENLDEVASQLSQVISFSKEEILKKVQGKKNFIWLQRQLKPELSRKIEKITLSGIHLVREYGRFYPTQNRASQVVGFSGVDPRGLEGLEYHFNDHLMGVFNEGEGKEGILPASHGGGDIYLTIHDQLQYVVEEELHKAVTTMKASNGIAIVMKSSTGEILSMANSPDYDPNRFRSYNSENYFNRAVANLYEPGSTFKIITVASALEYGKISKENILFCENGSYKIEDWEISDVAKYGLLTLQEIIQKSSNICAAKIGDLMSRENFYRKMQDFGFGKRTGISLPGEAKGKIKPYQTWSNVSVATMSYGYSISVTPIQMLTALNVIATKGILIPPRIIQKITDSEGNPLSLPERKSRRILRKEVAEEMTEYMTTVTERGGTGYSAGIQGLDIAGKTGTTRIYDAFKKQYSTQNHIRSFIGFFPAKDPELTIYVAIRDPQKNYMGTKGAAPVFRKIALQTMRVLGTENIPVTSYASEQMEVKSIFHAREPTTKKNSKNQFKSLTLREALAKSSRAKIRLNFRGSGVVKKEKKLGTTLRPKYEIELK